MANRNIGKRTIDSILIELFGRSYMMNDGERTKFMDYIMKEYGGTPSSATKDPRNYKVGDKRKP